MFLKFSIFSSDPDLSFLIVTEWDWSPNDLVTVTSSLPLASRTVFFFSTFYKNENDDQFSRQLLWIDWLIMVESSKEDILCISERMND